jgi:hypothetical protein
MRAFLIGCAAAIVIAVGAAFVLNVFQERTGMALNLESVRVPTS